MRFGEVRLAQLDTKICGGLSLRLSGLAPLERLLLSFEIIWDGI